MDRETTIKAMSPLITIAVMWVAQRAITAAYRGATGNEPPKPDDFDTSAMRVLIYAGASAAAVAIVQTSLQRKIAKASVSSRPATA